MKPSCKKSWPGNLLVCLDLTLGPLLQCQTKIEELKSAYDLLIFGPKVCSVKPTFRKSWAGNVLMRSDLTLGPSFKVK